MPEKRTDFDTAWKEALEQYLPAFLEFFFPQVYRDIDWSKRPEFLDKELQQAVRVAKRGQRVVDKLVQVWRKGGEEVWVLVHIEVQSQVDSDFPRRMYVCNVLLFSRHNRQVSSLAVLGDPSSDWRPQEFGYNLWGCEASFRLPVVKLLDYEAQWEALEQSTNPFATMVMAHLKTQATRRKPQARLQWKLQIARALYKRGFQREDIVQLLRLIELMMTLPEELQEDFDQALVRYEEEQAMPIMMHIERKAMERGMLQEAQESVMDYLEARFGRLPDTLAERIRQMENTSLLRALRRQAATVGSLEDFQQALP